MPRLFVATFCYVVIGMMGYLVGGNIAVSMADDPGHCLDGKECNPNNSQDCSPIGSGAGADCFCCPIGVCEAAC